MGCRICGKVDCTESFHSIEEQEEFCPECQKKDEIIKDLLEACKETTAALQIALANLNCGVSVETIGKLNNMKYKAEAAIEKAEKGD